ncbi:MAG: glycosyltransferase family 4 protein [Thermoplasmata archaeon]
MSVYALMIVSNSVTYDPRVRAEARSLVRQGHRVTVLGWNRGGEEPREEVIEGATVFRLSNTRAMRLLPFDLLRLRPWREAALREAMKIHEREPIDLVHCHDLDTLPIGVRLKRELRLPLLYDAHEIWGYMVLKDLPPPLPSYFLAKERRLAPHADHIVTVNEPLRAYFEGMASSVTVILNAKPVQGTSYEPPRNPTFTVLYIGSLNPNRFLLESVETVQNLEGVHFRIGGIGKPAYVASLRRRVGRSENVEFLGRVPYEDVLPLTRKADAILALFDPRDRLTRVGLPNKAFEAMAGGRPTIVSEGTYLAEFTKEHGLGLVVEHSREGLREGLVQLRDDPHFREELGRRAYQKAQEEFGWKHQEEELFRVYDELTRAGHPRFPGPGGERTPAPARGGEGGRSP